MPQTVTSGSAAFCTVAQFLVCHDVRTVGRLLSDDEVALSAAQVASSTALTTFLKEASGKVEAACLPGGRYTVADLQALQSPTMTNGGETLAGLVADLAMWRVWRRRPRKDDKVPVDIKEAQAVLQQLNDGVAIFGFQETADAGRLDHQSLTPDEVTRRNDRTVIAERYFGRRADRDPRNY